MIITDGVRAEVLERALTARPLEACGLLAFDTDGVLRQAYCVPNAAGSTVEFTIDPAEHHRMVRMADASGWTIRGAFHSHPAGPAVPSATDLAGAPGGEWIDVIVGLGGHAPEMRAWRVVAGVPVEEPLEAEE